MNIEKSVPEHTPLNDHYQSWAERNGFRDWALAMIWIVVAFVLFQLTAGIVSVVLFLIFEGFDSAQGVEEMLGSRMDLLFIGNSTGQILFLCLASYLVARLHVSREDRKEFLRLKLRTNTGSMTALTAVLFIVVQPAVWYIGYLNSLIPVPEYFSDLQQMQYQMIETFLRSDGILLLALFNIALVPAVCEEVMFRGYVQSAFEKSWGIWPAIIISGLLFGLFHIQLSNLLPLATLGVLLALVTWLSGSLVPAIVAHFVNNGGAVMLAAYFPDLAFAELSPETAPPVWVLVLSIALAFVIIRQLYRQSEYK